jgi:DNA-3-methyladenine glycosylase I
LGLVILYRLDYLAEKFPVRPDLSDQVNRCKWSVGDPLITMYHDTEWGTQVHDDNLLFEFLVLEGAQAGLSWLTVLKKRENYRKAFDRFDPEKVAQYDEVKINKLLKDDGIIRNKLKIRSSIENARRFLIVGQEFGSFDNYIWRFVNGKPLRNSWKSIQHVPAKTSLSDSISKELMERGFRFVGSTICYSFMQAVGLVNDHEISCFRYSQV